MPSTNEMILYLVANGFKLPERLGKRGRIVVQPCYAEEHCYPGENGFCNLDVFAYDVIACEFARQVDHDGPMHGVIARTEFNYLMSRGDTEAAIKALWEAVCGGTNES